MATLTDVLVPDIGDFEDVPVVEILVAVGDAIAKDDPMITLESDKATMEIPAPFAGVVKELKVKLDDRIAEGAVILTLEVEDEVAEPPPAPADDAATPTAPVAEAPSAEASPADGARRCGRARESGGSPDGS